MAHDNSQRGMENSDGRTPTSVDLSHEEMEALMAGGDVSPKYHISPEDTTQIAELFRVRREEARKAERQQQKR